MILAVPGQLLLVAPVLVLVWVAALPAAVVVMQKVPLLLLVVMVVLVLEATPWHHPGALRVWHSPTPLIANSPR